MSIYDFKCMEGIDRNKMLELIGGVIEGNSNAIHEYSKIRANLAMGSLDYVFNAHNNEQRNSD